MTDKLNDLEVTPDAGEVTEERVQNARERRNKAFQEFTTAQSLQLDGADTNVAQSIAVVEQLQDVRLKVTKAGTLIAFDKKTGNALDPQTVIKEFLERNPEFKANAITNPQTEKKDQARDASGKFLPTDVSKLDKIDQMIRFNKESMEWEPVVDVRSLTTQQRQVIFDSGINVSFEQLLHMSRQGKLAGSPKFVFDKDKMTGEEYRGLNAAQKQAIINQVGELGVARICARLADGRNTFSPNITTHAQGTQVNPWAQHYINKGFAVDVAMRLGEQDRIRGRRLPGS